MSPIILDASGDERASAEPVQRAPVEIPGAWRANEDVLERTVYDERDNKMVTQTVYDNTAVLEANKRAQNDAPEFGRYKGDLCHVGRVHMGDVTRLKNIGYDLLSADPEEVRRTLLYIQSNEPHLLTVPGKPFAKVRPQWE